LNIKRLLQILLLNMLVISMAGMALSQTHLILGGEDEEFDAMILRPRQMEEGPDGNLYVLDGGDSFIKVYSPAGDFLGKLAGPGAGPGEFQRTDGSTFGFTTDDKLFFTEFFGGHRWLTIMELNGDLIRTLSPQLQVNFGVQAAWSLDGGGFLVQISYGSEAYPVKNYYLYNSRRSLVEMDSEGAVLREIVETKHPSSISYTPNGGGSHLPYTPGFFWVACQDGTVIWADGMNPKLEVFDFEGNVVREIDTQLPPAEKVTEKDLKDWCRSRKEVLESNSPAWWNKFGRVIEEYEKSLFDQPVFGRISVAPEGHFLLRGPGNSETGQAYYMLFDNEGTMVDTVNVDAWKLHISANYLLFFSENEDGSTAVNAIRWSGPVEEALSHIK